MDSTKIAFNYSRRFGVEMEFNSLDYRNFIDRPLSKDELPQGIDYFANLLLQNFGYSVKINTYHHTHNNSNWVVKPDRSCGIEVCSPVMKGWSGLKAICEVADLFSRDSKIIADNRCSFHVHIDVSDLTRSQVARILTYWVKCEPVFIDSVPPNRKRNKYCQCIGLSNLFRVDMDWEEDIIINRLGSNDKYYTLNCEHYWKRNRDTIEVRIGEAEGCINPYLIKNWVRLLIHFVEVTKDTPAPCQYNPGDPWSGFCWLDVMDVFKLLGFMDEERLSVGMKQTRDWFISRIYRNVVSDFPGVWSNDSRIITKEQIIKLANQVGLDVSKIENLKPSNPDLIYSNDFRH